MLEEGKIYLVKTTRGSFWLFKKYLGFFSDKISGCSCALCLDDMSKYREDGSVSRPYVDWARVEQLLKEKGVIDFDNNDYLTGNNSCVY